jgi:hypothetical protein
LASRISVSANDVEDPAAFGPQQMRVVLKSGAALEETVTALPGSPTRPLSERAQRDKAERCVAFAIGPDAGHRAATLQALLMDPACDDAFVRYATLVRRTRQHERGGA